MGPTGVDGAVVTVGAGVLVEVSVVAGVLVVELVGAGLVVVMLEVAYVVVAVVEVVDFGLLVVPVAGKLLGEGRSFFLIHFDTYFDSYKLSKEVNIQFSKKIHI